MAAPDPKDKETKAGRSATAKKHQNDGSNYRDSKSGQFVTKEKAKKSPSTHQKEKRK